MKAISDPLWYAPVSLAEMKALFVANPSSQYRCVAGDTGRGKCNYRSHLLLSA